MNVQTRSLSHRRRLASSLWTPASPTAGGYTPAHWYRSDGPLWQDAGITPATSDGDVIGRWEDLTANADHLNQTTAANKPTLQNGPADLLNGHPTIKDDGTDDYLYTAFPTGGSPTQPLTIFAVAKLWSNPTNVRQHLWSAASGVNNFGKLNVAAAPDTWELFCSNVLNGGVADTSWHIWTVVEDGASSAYWSDGVLTASGNAGASGINAMYMFIRQDLNFPLKGYLTEFLLYAANLPDADKNQVGRYLGTRYALAYTDI